MAETCIWCGHEPLDDMAHETVYACGSVQHPRSDVWSQSAGCVEIMRSRERIQRAVEVLEGAERYDVESCEDSVSFDYHDHGQQADAEVLDRTLETLRGNSPESPDSPPVTTDDLAVSDYFEAVRQRVPWMVSVKHIEGLVEWYRQCGVMACEAAKQIQSVYGGWYGQAE